MKGIQGDPRGSTNPANSNEDILVPSPLCNVDLEGDACQETVRDPENNIELGGGGGGEGECGGFLVY